MAGEVLQAVNGTSANWTQLATTDLNGVTATSAEVNLLDGAIAGDIVNSKAVVYSAFGSVEATAFFTSELDTTTAGGPLAIGGNSASAVTVARVGAPTQIIGDLHVDGVPRFGSAAFGYKFPNVAGTPGQVLCLGTGSTLEWNDVYPKVVVNAWMPVGSPQNIPAGSQNTWIDIVYPSKSGSGSADYDATSGKYTCTKSGEYQMTVHTSTDDISADSKGLQLRLWRINANALKRMVLRTRTSKPAYPLSTSTTTNMELNAGEIYQLQIWCEESAAWSLQENSSYNQWVIVQMEK